jgi:hypothetical protein
VPRADGHDSFATDLRAAHLHSNYGCSPRFPARDIPVKSE